MKKIYKRKSNFTIVELLVAMGVFSILMLALMQFFTGAQQIWQKSSARSEVFENARVALDLMATDLQCAYYEMNHSKKRIFFAADDYDSNSSSPTYKTFGKIAFGTERSVIPGTAGSRICQVKYWLDTSTYELKINEVWNSDSTNWKITEDMSSDITQIYNSGGATLNFSGTAFAGGVDSVGTTNTVVPCVLDLRFTLYRYKSATKEDVEITDSSTDADNKAARFPCKVEISITVVDKVTFDRWKSVSTDLDSDILKPGMRTFTRVVLIERGQYD